MATPRFVMEWQAEETAAALKAQYRAEPRADLRMRLHGLWLLHRGQTVDAVAASMGVSRRTVQRWVAWYRQGGLPEVRAHRQGGHGQPARLTPEQAEHLAQEVSTGRFRTAAEIGAWITATFGVSYRPGGLQSLLTRLKCWPKVPRPVHPQADRQAQDQWKKGGSRRRWPQPA